MSLRDDILAIDDLPTESVEVPEWGVTLAVRSMTGAERDRYEMDLMQDQQKAKKNGKEFGFTNIRARLVVMCTVDADGKRVFHDDDVERVGRKSSAAIVRLYDAASKLNAISDEEVAELAGESNPSGNVASISA